MSEFRLLAYRESQVTTFPLDDAGTEWKVGRATECDIRLDDPSVSRVHLALRRTGDEFRFDDLGGSNPLLMHGQKVVTGVLPTGVPLVVGGTVLYLDRVAKHADTKIHGGDGGSGRTRRYLDDPPSSDPELPGLTQPAAAAAELLASFVTASEDSDNLPETAAALLDVTMRWLRFRQGTVVAFVGGASFEVLASRSRDGSSTLSVSKAILDELRLRRRAFLQAGTASGRNPALVAVPLGDPVVGGLVLSHPLPDLVIDDRMLRSAQALGKSLWSRLQELRRLHQLRDQVSRIRFEDSPSHAALAATSRLNAVCRELQRAADHSLPIFLVGEDGTEKEDLARYAHAQSARAARPFVAFHAGIIPPARAEEELFGSTRTSVVSRVGDTSRALLRAQGGTFYLEEPELLPEHVQDRLARALATREVAIGPNETIPLDVRVIAASTEQPAATGERRKLRPGLAEVLIAITLEVPPLRSAPADVLTLTEQILSEMSPAPDGVARTISAQASELLLACSWPGNVRQLRRALEVAAARAGNRPIQPRDLPNEVRAPQARDTRLLSLDEVERNHISAVLEAVGGVKTRAAEVLGIAPSTLYEKLRRHAK